MDESQANPVLAPTLASFKAHPRKGIDLLSSHSCRAIQVDARSEGTRPSDLGPSGRRDLAGLIRKRGMTLAGLDLWLPESAFLEAGTIDRAVDRTLECIDLAAELGHCTVSMCLPPAETSSQLDAAIETILGRAGRQGVRIADHAPGAASAKPLDVHAHGLGLDPASLMVQGEDPVEAVHAWGERLASARLIDLAPGGGRILPTHGGGGRLDLVSYKVALGLNPGCRQVVLDLRGCPDPLQGLLQAGQAWASAI